MIGHVVEERYLVEQELGEGAMGRVYAARHIKVGRRVAIKVMHKELARVPSIVERFAREAMIAARLRHPNLVSVLDVGMTANKEPLIVLELAPGKPLSALMTEAMAADRAIHLVTQLLLGLEHAHAAGLIHRDLKPDNILVETTADGNEIPRIVDFGIAITRDRDDSVAGRRLTDENTVIGTPFYMSPEQALGHEVDQRTDLFALGMIMYELLAGSLPFPGTNVDVALANAHREPPSIAECTGVVADPLLEIFARKLMARRRSMRFASARDALDALAVISRDRIAAARALANLEAEPVAIQAVSLPPADRMVTLPLMLPLTREVVRTRVIRRHRTVAALAAAALAITVVVGFTMRSGSAPAARVASSSTTPVEAVTIVVAAEPVIARAQPVVAPEPAVAQPSVAAPVVTPTAAPVTPRLVAPATRSQSVTRSRPTIVQTTKPTMAPVVAPAAAPAPVATDAEVVIAKYVAVARALKQRPGSDALWQRFRLIRINDAIATASGRRAVLAVLDLIEVELRAPTASS